MVQKIVVVWQWTRLITHRTMGYLDIWVDKTDRPNRDEERYIWSCEDSAGLRNAASQSWIVSPKLPQPNCHELAKLPRWKFRSTFAVVWRLEWQTRHNTKAWLSSMSEFKSQRSTTFTFESNNIRIRLMKYPANQYWILFMGQHMDWDSWFLNQSHLPCKNLIILRLDQTVAIRTKSH